MHEHELRIAAAAGDITSAKKNLDNNDVQINDAGKTSGNTALHFAAIASESNIK